MMNQRTNLELFDELERHLRVLKDHINRVEKGEEDYIKEIPNKLRLLVADDSRNAHGGLLIFLNSQYPSNIKIKWNDEEHTLEDFINKKMMGINEKWISRKNFIKQWAQSYGGSHEAISVNLHQSTINTIFSLSKTEQTDMEKGIALKTAVAVYDFGDKFAKELKQPTL